MRWALLRFLVSFNSVVTFSHALDSTVGFGGFDDNSIEDYDYDYEALLNYFLIFPGTKWCGTGDIATDDNDLGSLSETDSCCRTHDMCPDIIEAGQTKYGLTNYALYTRLNCDCDNQFLSCLKNSKDKASELVGKMYFDLLKTKCFKSAHKITGCKQYSSFGTRCKEYTFDSASPEFHQWFEVPPFSKK